MITSVDKLIDSVEHEDQPPGGLCDGVKALWFTKKGRWEDAHDIAQDIETKLGSWIHAHLHLIEGDQWNAGYWYSRAGKPESGPDGIAEEWLAIAEEALNQS